MDKMDIKFDKKRHSSAFEIRSMSLSDWYVLSIPGQCPVPENELPKIAAAQSVGDPRGKADARECKESVSKLKARGWIRIVNERTLLELKSKAEGSEYGLPLYGFPELGFLDFTPQGVKVFQSLSDDLYGQFFFSEAVIDKSRSLREIYTVRFSRLQNIIHEASMHGKETRIVEIGPWSIFWWKTFASGYKVSYSVRKSRENPR